MAKEKRWRREEAKEQGYGGGEGGGNHDDDDDDDDKGAIGNQLIWIDNSSPKTTSKKQKQHTFLSNVSSFLTVQLLFKCRFVA